MIAYANSIVGGLKILIWIGIAYTAVDAAVFFASDARGREPLAIAIDGAANRSVAIEEIVAANLFGHIIASPANPLDADTEAPDSRLDLTLQGVFQAKDPRRSTAIVAENNKPAQVYTIGATIYGNAMLARVSEDYIVLRRAGSLETLRFPQARNIAVGLPDDSSEFTTPSDAAESSDASNQPPRNDYGDDLPPPLDPPGRGALGG